ncbi:cannabidiolic acid synthase [Phtheirospermum japonicum]|uniref:Cannabidiolic acid synthase n=1 Tax=Phtheirospermum japonicum TaxID=374723 RepID=A0A830CNK9_9LAMI|nr:cannabidiolic acid synthase [Phtheirospermum japonicum]
MEFPRTKFLISLVFANLSVLGFSSSPTNTNSFLGCLTDQFGRSNSPTDVIITPTNASSYAFLLESQNLRPESTSPLKPLLIVTPFHDSEIQASIYCSKKLGTEIRTRSGGHDYEGLSYTSQNPFIIVDMRNLRSITIDNGEKTAWVETGATVGQLYYTLAKNSKTLTFPAGVCPTVGIGGHLSGGGYGMLSRKHGLASDHIIDAKLIDADGNILDRGSMGEDLFWALRGGGSASFGVILAFKVSLIVVPETLTGFVVTRTLEQNATQLVYRWQHVADKVDESLSLRVSLNSVGSPPTSGNRTIVATFNALYLGRVNDLLPLMEREFPELGLVENDCTEMSWIESVLFFASLRNRSLDVLVSRIPQKPFTPSFYKGKSDFVITQIPINGLVGIWRFLHDEEAEHRGALEFSPFGGQLSNFSESESPFPHRAGNIFMIRYGVVWNKEGNEELQRHLDWIRRLYSYMTRYVAKAPRTAYFNYKDLDLGIDLDIGVNNNEGKTSYAQASVWGTKYFKNNFDRLVRVKTTVDPEDFFRNEQSIPSLHSEKED